MQVRQIRKGRENGKAEGGFTLIEVLIAMAIFTIGVLAVFAMQTNSMTRSGNAVKSNQAGFWAQDKVEMLMRQAYDDPDLDSVSSAGGSLIHRSIGGPYNVSWAVFSSAENGSSINSYGAAFAGDPMFASVDTAQNLTGLSANAKFVMVYVSHPLGEVSRVTFLKPNI